MRITVEGLPEVEDTLKELPRVARIAAQDRAIKAAAAVVVSAIVARAVFRKGYATGRLAGAIAFFPSQVGGEPSGLVKPDRRMKGAPGRHAHLVEYGTAAHAALYYGRSPYTHPGTAAQAFFHPGVEASADQALDVMLGVIDAEVTGYWTAHGGDVA